MVSFRESLVLSFFVYIGFFPRSISFSLRPQCVYPFHVDASTDKSTPVVPNQRLRRSIAAT